MYSERSWLKHEGSRHNFDFMDLYGQCDWWYLLFWGLPNPWWHHLKLFIQPEPCTWLLEDRWKPAAEPTFMFDGPWGMLGWKDYWSLDMVFPFVSTFLDRRSRISERPRLLNVNTLYFDLLHDVYNGLRKLRWTEVYLQVMNSETSHF